MISYIKTSALISVLFFCTLTAFSQQSNNCLYGGEVKMYNQTYDVFMVINLKDMNISVPGHELYGPLPGYLGKKTSSFYWMIVDADMESEKATLQLVNDFGSEDLSATIEQLNDSTFRLTQGKGSTIKVPNNGKWMKLPGKIDFKREKN